MANRLRVARLALGRYRPLGTEAPDAARHRRLDALIRRHLPGVTASLLAQPSPSADGDFIDWYSDLAGQPVALSALAEGARAEARALLDDRLKSLAALAKRLEPVDPEAAGQLREALSFPGEETVYVIGGQPVITFWGHRSPAAVEPPPLAAPAASPPVPDPAPRRWHGRGLWLGLALLMLAVAGAALVAFDGLRWPPWGPDFAALLAAAREEEAALSRRTAELEARLNEELARCAAERALIAARDEEQRLRTVLADARDRLTEALALCPLKQQLEDVAAEGQTLHDKLAQLTGNLNAVLAQCRRLKADERKTDERKQTRERTQASACVTVEGEAPPLDIYFLQDLTGSFRDDLPNMVKMVTDLVARAESGAFGPDVRFGLGSFMDKPHPVFGTRNTYVYKNHLNLTREGAALISAVRGLKVVLGGDGPEAQHEALIEMVANARNIGFRKEARRFVVLLTDAPPHVAGDWRPGGPLGAPRLSSGKGGVGPLDEDYPSPEQAMAALRSAGITPIFLVSGSSIRTYQAFVEALGTGVSRPLSPDSANVLDALLEGLKRACQQ